MRLIFGGLLAAALACLTLPCLAQYSANIQGTVQDPSGAGIHGAHLLLINPNTGQKLSAVSDATGTYR
ncbi:MAG: carboxypeptidase-like regulatory domain-containing protein, partial [Terracidiphilus sp.]